MSEKYEVPVADFTGKELDQVITMLVAVGEEQKMELPEVPEKHSNKSAQAETVNALVAVVGMRPYRVTEGDIEALSTPDETPEVDSVMIVAMDYQTPENTTNDEEESEEENADAGEGESQEEGDTTEGGDASGDGEEAEEEGEQDEPDPTPSKENPEPVRATGEQRYKGELVVDMDNRIMNGRMYVEVKTIQASYMLSPDEAKEAGLTVRKK